MQFFTRSSPAARTALVYITVGTMLVVWTGVWWAYLYRNPPTREAVYYVVAGLSISGVLLLVIGLCLGRIGQSAKGAESPVEVATAPVAAVAPPVAAVAPNPAPVAAGTAGAFRQDAPAQPLQPNGSSAPLSPNPPAETVR